MPLYIHQIEIWQFADNIKNRTFNIFSVKFIICNERAVGILIFHILLFNQKKNISPASQGCLSSASPSSSCKNIHYVSQNTNFNTAETRKQMRDEVLLYTYIYYFFFFFCLVPAPEIILCLMKWCENVFVIFLLWYVVCVFFFCTSQT